VGAFLKLNKWWKRMAKTHGKNALQKRKAKTHGKNALL